MHIDEMRCEYMQKSERHRMISQVIERLDLSRQDQIVDQLNKDGLGVTQASISRDLVELGIVKANGVYTIPKTEKIAGLGTIEFTTAGECLVVAKCQSGVASAIAVRIDSAGIKEILGTIAGDDTIFIAVQDPVAQRSVIKQLWEVLTR